MASRDGIQSGTPPAYAGNVPTPPVVPAEPEADLALSGRHLLALRPALASTQRLTVEALAELVEDASASLATRHAAGLHLALVGDPRISADGPTMIHVPAANTIIGIEPHRVDTVTAEWAALGVQRGWIAKESPRHTVHVAAFRIAKYLVTNGEYLAYVLHDPTAERPTAWAHGVYPIGADNQPVYSVSPDAADAYASWLAARTGRAFRLPTEAEWEYAATGGDGRQYPWGDVWNVHRANTAEAGPLTTTPVGLYVEGYSPFGVADMAGNVEEYVADDYRPYPGATVIHDDLIDTHGATYRIARGGSYARHGDLARCARRHGWYPSDHFAMGFRLAES
jgi:toxoflavin biosynthesis protein ToxD